MRNYILVFLGGGLGASARYYLSGTVYRFLPSDFPYGNLIVNITGCFTIGLLMTMMEERFLSDPSLRVFLTIGILGGFTTFSSFSYETVALLRDAEFLRASLNIGASVFGCLAATILGMFIGRFV
ncbi:MAG: fluoride efflux transporter CrcB [Ignavibacteriae bacterium]|nr:MAG: fluoride efflux transporter CrcB [Ignavibacteriota bacterium]